jgi:hypothetical protein
VITDGRGDARPAPLRKKDFTTEELAESVYLNCVGTFGVASAGHWWGRAAGAILRLTHHVLGHEDAIGALIDSDDGNIRAGDEWRERNLLLHLLVLVVLGVPPCMAQGSRRSRGGVERLLARLGQVRVRHLFQESGLGSAAAGRQGARRSRPAWRALAGHREMGLHHERGGTLAPFSRPSPRLGVGGPQVCKTCAFPR